MVLLHNHLDALLDLGRDVVDVAGEFGFGIERGQQFHGAGRAAAWRRFWGALTAPARIPPPLLRHVGNSGIPGLLRDRSLDPVHASLDVLLPLFDEIASKAQVRNEIFTVRVDVWYRIEPPMLQAPMQCHRFVFGETTSDGVLSS